jgi:hypothetical protein
MDDVLLTTAEAAALARRRPTAIRNWSSRRDAAGRRLLEPADRDARGRPLYSPADVLRAERTARQRDDTTRSRRAVDGL